MHRPASGRCRVLVKGHLPRHVEQIVNAMLEARVAVRTPCDPQLEDVVVPPALDGLVARVIDDVILLVFLE